MHFSRLSVRITFAVWTILAILFLTIALGCGKKDKPQPAPTPKVQTQAPTTTPPDQRWYDLYFSQVYTGDPVAAKQDPNSIDRKLALKLVLAQKSIDAALHELDSDTVTHALLEAHRRGVTLRLVTETDYMDEHSILELQEAGIPVVNDAGRGGLMHNKFIIVDDRYVWTGSLNTTDNGAYKNNNNAIWIDSPKLAENFSAEFQEMYDGRSFGIRSATTLTHPVVQMPDGTSLRTLFAPENDVISGLLGLLQSAQESIYFMAFSFTHDEIGAAMKQKSAAGVDVRGIFEKRGSDTEYSELPAMRALGMSVMQDTNHWVLHHKVIIIDGKTVVTGSFNFSNNAAKTNDENVLIIENNSDIGRAYTEEFNRLSGTGLTPSTSSPSSLATRKQIPTSVTSLLNINTASQAAIEALPGIGVTLAKRIIQGRPYRNWESLGEVPGLGPSTLEKLQGKINF